MSGSVTPAQVGVKRLGHFGAFRREPGPVALAFGVLASMIVFWFSRRRERRDVADQTLADRLDERAMVADEHDQSTVRSAHIGQRPVFSIHAGQVEIRRLPAEITDWGLQTNHRFHS